MSDIYDGGPAFPHKPTRTEPAGAGLFVCHPGDHPGMSLRDYFAAKALASAISCMVDETLCHEISSLAEEQGITLKERIAIGAYEYADAMLKARQS